MPYKALSTSVIFVLSLGLTGCASYFKRKECEKTNWFQHGYGVAMAGKRLDADDHLKQCQKVEAKIAWTEVDTGFKSGMNKYCTADNVFAVGKAGNPFSYDMCDGESLKKMRAKYAEGLKIFCTPSNAYRFGSTGGLYQNVCPNDVEEAWMGEYRKGRKVYLKALIEEKEREVARLEGDLNRLEKERQSLSLQQVSLAQATVIQKERVYDPNTGTYRESVNRVPDQQAQVRSQAVANEMSNVDYQLRRTREKQNLLNDELAKMRTEMATL